MNSPRDIFYYKFYDLHRDGQKGSCDLKAYYEDKENTLFISKNTIY